MVRTELCFVIQMMTLVQQDRRSSIGEQSFWTGDGFGFPAKRYETREAAEQDLPTAIAAMPENTYTRKHGTPTVWMARLAEQEK